MLDMMQCFICKMNGKNHCIENNAIHNNLQHAEEVHSQMNESLDISALGIG